MIKAAMKWIANMVGQYSILQIVTTAPMAYFAGLVVEVKRGAGIVFDALPPLFWPIFAALVLLVAGYHGFAVPAINRQQERKNKKDELLRHTYWMVKHAVNPKILDESNPDRENADKLFAIAQSTLFNFVADCKKEGWWKDASFPQPVKDQDTLLAWERFLMELRERVS